tara:strand:- start:572 stop:1456 length:885 start_codon:yes stop_codon:yes gene_type:complete
MQQITHQITEIEADAFEEYFCEEVQDYWVIYSDKINHVFKLCGYFETVELAKAEICKLEASFEKLEITEAIEFLEDQNWKEAYKLHFKPWNKGSIHWVPEWERETYKLPTGHTAIYLDPGMAFGTGNHPTTRLCAGSILLAAEKWKDSLSSRIVVDAGCGSGILALSAKKIGFGNVVGFDIDEEAVRISLENLEENGLSGAISFETKGLEYFEDNKADLIVANIQSNILIPNADLLFKGLRAGGTIMLSGILRTEASKVLNAYQEKAKELGIEIQETVEYDEEWSGIRLDSKAK